jgi:hypothetical protein
MEKKLILLIVFFFCFERSFGQTKRHSIQKKENPFEMVHVDDSVRKKLNSFIWEREKDSTEIGAGVLIHHILMKDKANNYKFVKGIYWFKLIGTHSNLYYFIYTPKDGIQIIKDYSVENILTKVLEYFRKNESSLNEREKLNYIGSIINDLKYKDDTSKPGFYGDYEIKKTGTPKKSNK